MGVYGVIAHFAARRRRDWAIRMALGLTGPKVLGYLVRRAAWLVLAGIGIGVIAATGLTRLLASFLYGVGAVDAFAFLTAGAALLAAGLLAAFIPALRLAMADPMIGLRES